MTPAEHRAKCIEAIEKSILRMYRSRPREIKYDAIEILESLHGIARVVPSEATEEMQGFLDERWFRVKNDDFREIFDIMSAAGDLTNPPEKKP